MSNERLLSAVARYSDCTLLCAGDVMLDHFVYGDVARISPEAPIPVVSVEREESMLGGAGNVVRNLTSLGAKVIFVTVTGDDAAADEVSALLGALPNCDAHVLRDPQRRTSVKTRYLAHNQQLIRVDRETVRAMPDGTFQELLGRFAASLPRTGLTLLSDYGKGVLSGPQAREFISACQTHGKQVHVDPKGRDFQRYRGAALIKPNLKELAEAANLPVGNAAEIETAARHLIRETGCPAILVTRGSAGMMLVRETEKAVSFRARAREVYDVSGAGDTVAATLALGVAAALTLEEAVEMSCLAAGLVVAKVGTATLTQSEVLHELESDGLPSGGKILSREQALHRVGMWRRGGYRIGLAAGTFEPLAAAQVGRLREAKNACGKLVLGLVKSGREETADRAVLLAAMACVDLVVLVDATEVPALFQELAPEAIAEITVA